MKLPMIRSIASTAMFLSICTGPAAAGAAKASLIMTPNPAEFTRADFLSRTKSIHIHGQFNLDHLPKPGSTISLQVGVLTANGTISGRDNSLYVAPGSTLIIKSDGSFDVDKVLCSDGGCPLANGLTNQTTQLIYRSELQVNNQAAGYTTSEVDILP